MPLIISGVLIFFVIRFQKRKRLYELELRDTKIREQELIIENQKVLEKERNRIAAEMHDDLGSGLTTIKFLSDIVANKKEQVDSTPELNKIANQANKLITNMSEIIWAMHSGFDDIENLVAYIRRYAYEYLQPYPIDLDFKKKVVNRHTPISGEKRRNIFLIVKELIHNSVKHSQCSEINLSLSYSDKFYLHYHDNGVGFDRASSIEGNGLRNMQNRAERIQANLVIHSKKGCFVTLSVKLT